MTYSQKLKDPRWQKKRLEILNRDNFTCRCCGDSESTLHVHHKMYISGRDVWDYDNMLLITLCELCHTSQHEQKKEYETLLLETLYMKGFSYDDLRELACCFYYYTPFIKHDIVNRSLGCLLNDPISIEALTVHYFGEERIEVLKKEFSDGTTKTK